MSQEFVDFGVEGLDLSGVKPWDGEYTLVPPGTYVVEVVGVDKDQSKESTKPFIEVKFRIADGQATEEAAAFTGQHLWGRYFLTDKAKGRLVSLMMACGAPLDQFRASAVYGAKLMVDVIHNPGAEKTNENGEPLPVKMFANVIRERAIEGKAPAESAPPPPITNKAKTPAATTKPAANGQAQARRA